MSNFLSILSGKKTYIIAAVVVLLSLYQAVSGHQIPDIVWEILGGLGLGTLRAAVNKTTQAVQDATTATSTPPSPN